MQPITSSTPTLAARASPNLTPAPLQPPVSLAAAAVTFGERAVGLTAPASHDVYVPACTGARLSIGVGVCVYVFVCGRGRPRSRAGVCAVALPARASPCAAAAAAVLIPFINRIQMRGREPYRSR